MEHSHTSSIQKKGLRQCIVHISLLVTLVTISCPTLFFVMGLFSGAIFTLAAIFAAIGSLLAPLPVIDNPFFGFLLNHTQFDLTGRDTVMQRTAIIFFDCGVVSATAMLVLLVTLIPVFIVVYHYTDLCEYYGCCRGIDKDE